jgi:hypothetical protein
MSAIHRQAEVGLKLFEFIDRKQAGLPSHHFPTNTGVLLASEDLLRAAGHSPDSKRPRGWRKAADGFGRRNEDRNYTLRVIKLYIYWFVMRRPSRSDMSLEYLALIFDEVPLCTRTEQEAMRLADHCHPDPSLTIAGCWVPAFRR